MKKAFLIIGLLFFVNSVCFAQEAGNRIYGNQGYAKNKRTPTTNGGNILNNGVIFVEASVLLNLKPDSYVVVFSIAQEAKTAEESNNKVNDQIVRFTRSLNGLGITSNDIYVDFITQNKVYDYEIKGDVAEQFLDGFETKKTVAIKYKDKKLFEKILITATNVQIFDLIKVDYIVSDFDSIREKLFDEAVKVIKKKEAKYVKSFDMYIKPIGLAIEKYDAFYPAERYESYRAFETGTVRSRDLRTARTTLSLRKSTTFFYEPIEETKFDKVINPIGIEPTVQFTIYMQAQYRLV